MKAQRVGSYILGERLGSGGMGEVHVAAHLGPLGIVRVVALKKLHPHLARDADFVAMFVDEARIQSAIAHPNVVRVLDAHAADGELYVAMDLVTGLSIAEIGRELRAAGTHDPIPESIVVALGCDILEGLHAAHELCTESGASRASGRSGVIHRDLSPHNVLVSVDGTARVLDFGIAKTLGRARATLSGQLRGKPAYMSPEQLDGEGLDRRTDIFSAALVIAELASQSRAFTSADVPDVRREMRIALGDPYGWLRARGMSEALSGALAPCLALDRDQRPDTARGAGLALTNACALAPRARVAEWLEATVPTSLAAQRALAARVLAKGLDGNATTATGPRPPRERLTTEPRRRTAAPVLALGGAALGAALATVALQLVSPRGARNTEALAAEARPALAHSQRVEATTPASASASASSPAMAANAAPAVAAPPNKYPSERTTEPRPIASTHVAATKASVSPAASHRTPEAPSCDPPYLVDATGVRIFRPECL